MRKKYINILFAVAFTIILVAILLKQLNLHQSIFSKKGETSLGLTKIIDIPLAGMANRFYYQSIDYSTQHLYISHLGSSMVHVFDLGKQKVIKDILLTSSPY